MGAKCTYALKSPEANTLAGQLVDARGGHRAAVNPEITPADVVHQDEHHVGLPLLSTLAHVVSPGGSDAHESLLEHRLGRHCVRLLVPAACSTAPGIVCSARADTRDELCCT
jgi:hypothetical protein